MEERTDKVKRAIEGLRKLMVDKLTSGVLCVKILENLETMEMEETAWWDDRSREIRIQIKEVTRRM